MVLPSPSIVTSKTEENEKREQPWQPKLVVFLCKWCSYTGDDLAAISSLSHKSLIEIIRVPCSGRVAPLFLLKCFEKGADGILISGCSPGSCRYSAGNYQAQKNLTTFRTLLEFCGFDARRIHFSWTSTADGAHWAKLIDHVVSQVTEAGPLADTKPVGAGPCASPRSKGENG